jgi:hypothetical protein
MAGHKNAEISKLGREIFAEQIKHNGASFREDRQSPTGYYYIEAGEQYPCKVYTKRYDEFEGYRVTGRNKKEILEFNAIQRDFKCRLALFFIDAALGQCYGDFLDTLLTTRRWGGETFPMVRDTHKGKIYFFSVETIPTVFLLTQEQKKELALLISDNKSDKFQTKLF